MGESPHGRVDDYLLFLRVVTNGGFSAAARATGVPQATISRRIATLEESFGVRLLHRSTRRMSLTPAGDRLVVHARHLAETLEAANAAVEGLRATPSGPLSLSAPVALGQWLLGDVLGPFSRRFPEVTLRVELTNRRVDLVEEGYDVALRVGDVGGHSLIARRLGSGRSGLFAAPAYLDQATAVTTPDQLPSHRTLHNGRGGPGTIWRLRDGKGTAEVVLHPLMSINDAGLILALAVQGLGIARLPNFVAAPAVASGALVPVLPEWSSEAVDVHVVFPSHRGMTPSVRALIDLTVELLPASLR